MRLLFVLSIVLFTAIAVTLSPGCARLIPNASEHKRRSTQKPSQNPKITNEVETIEIALRKTSERISLQHQWLKELKSAESELSQPEPDYGW